MAIEIKGKIDDSGLLARLDRAPHTIKRKASKVVRGASLAVERRIKIEMPVDTGRARASWAHWTPGDIVSPSPDSGADDAIWEVSGDGLTITQGTNVEYVELLNDGHSKQAPSGFIDKAVDVGARVLEDGLGEIEGL